MWLFLIVFLLQTDTRRITHISAEQKRRFNIKLGFDTLHSLVTTLSSQPSIKVFIMYNISQFYLYNIKQIYEFHHASYISSGSCVF